MKPSGFNESLDLWKTPERVALVTSIDENDKAHVITVSWFTRVSFEPPMFAIAVGQSRSMHNLINQSKEFVLAIPGEDIAQAVLGCGKRGGNLEDRFDKYNLKVMPADKIKSPLIKNCQANYECVVKDTLDVGDHTLFIGKVKASWMNEQPVHNLLIAGDEPGYEIVAESGPYKLGYLK